MFDNRSIGVFDSGLGGLTVLSALRQKFPQESMVYLGDTARVPYGTKSPETVIKYAFNNAKALQDQADLKLLVVACNTATAHALPALKQVLSIPVVGVIEPGVQAVLEHPELRSVAVLGTAGTIQSGVYEKALREGGFSGEIYPQACPLWVPLVEEGLVSGEIAVEVAKHYLERLPALPDAVILGCTHYPLLLSVLKALLPSKTLWVDSGAITAQLLDVKACDRLAGEVSYLVSDSPKRFQALAPLFLGSPVLESQIRLIDVGVLA